MECNIQQTNVIKTRINRIKSCVPKSVRGRIRKALFARSWHRDLVGGLWETMGQRQLAFLVEQGLKEHHYMLDVGCGCLRAGIHFSNYLDDNHYFGIDIDQRLLDAGRQELKRAGMTKSVTLDRVEDFDARRFGQLFDFAIAQSVFTHLPLNPIIQCIMNVEKVLRPGGKFFATFFENPQGKRNLEPIVHHTTDVGALTTYFDKDPFHYDFGTFEGICEQTSLTVEKIGAWDHPRDQRMLMFVKRSYKPIED